jgi:hypothetical protein
MTRNRDALKIRNHLTERLYLVASNHLTYPPLSRNRWFLPIVLDWEPYDRNPTDRFYGWFILPSAVVFTVPPVDLKGFDEAKTNKLAFDLLTQTGDKWHVEADLSQSIIVALRLSREVIVRVDDRNSEYFNLPWEEDRPRRAVYIKTDKGLVLDESADEKTAS